MLHSHVSHTVIHSKYVYAALKRHLLYPPATSYCLLQDAVTTLLGPSGSFGINRSQYRNNMRREWKIEVDAVKVSNICIKYNANKVVHTFSIAVAV